MRRARRNSALRPGDGVKVVPTPHAIASGWSGSHAGWLIETLPDGWRVLFRQSDPARHHWPVIIKATDATLEPFDAGPTPESLGGSPVRWVLVTGRNAWDKRYLRETGSQARFGWYEWVRDPREATHYRYLGGGAYAAAARIRASGSSAPDVERYTVPDVSAEVHSLAEKYAAVQRVLNAKPKPPKAKREKLTAEATRIFALMTDLVTRDEAELATRHAGALANRRRRQSRQASRVGISSPYEPIPSFSS